MTTIKIPEMSLVVLVGPSGSGKSTFAAKHFAPTEVVSSDACRALVADDANDQSATTDAFAVLHYIAGKRLDRGNMTVVDATSVQREAREPLVALARAHDVLPIAIVFDVSESLCAQRNEQRPDRTLPDHALHRQHQQMRRSIKGLQREGFRRVFVLHGPEEIDAVEGIERERLWVDKRGEHGPFDIIGDIHGCIDETVALLRELGYVVAPDRSTAQHPDARQAFFVGDLVDRGPGVVEVLRLVMGMVRDGSARCVPGNHENKLGRVLAGRKVQLTHGLAESLTQIEMTDQAFKDDLVEFLDGLVSHALLDDGKLVVSHAGLPEKLQGRSSGRVRSFAMYGETTGETDEFGLPVRYPWANDYRGSALVVYGHTPVPEPEWINNTICIDTGCVFGGRLTALRYPERELVSVPAERTYYEPTKPLVPESSPAAPAADRPSELLDVEDVMGKRIIDTPLHPKITIREENATAALEVMSRFAVDPRWLVYLPPTMAPTATSARPELLEHPEEAFASYRSDRIDKVMCEEKHMGSRAVAVVCREPVVAARRFRIESESAGVVFTRTGRPFFSDPAWQDVVLDRLRAGINAAGLWDELETDWLVLDCELLPWNAKAGDLLRNQYASVGAAGTTATASAVAVLSQALGRGVDVAPVLARASARVEMVEGFVKAYRHYCRPVDSVDDLRLAPFVVLAGEGHVHAGRDHLWHMGIAARLAEHGPAFIAPTRHAVVDVNDPASTAAGIAFWEQLTHTGGEGMVVKPLESIVRGRKGLVQPGIKCRGPEYLRIIYGPEYTADENLERLRRRGLSHKRSLAQREFALGIEALERFVRGEPLYLVHECVFGVLALESEPVDPRL